MSSVQFELAQFPIFDRRQSTPGSWNSRPPPLNGVLDDCNLPYLSFGTACS